MADDYYKTLGIGRDASSADIQKAYRDLARKYHPDLNPDDKTAKTKFQEVQRAFDVLNDPSKRELYDRYGSSFESMGAGGGPQGGRASWNTGPAGGEEIDFSQLFGDRYGGGDPSGMFGDLFGQFRRAGGAGTRKASRGGAPRGADITSELEIPFNTAVSGGEAHISVQRPDGHVETLAVKIPAGISEGKKIRLRGQGASAGGPAGDILITVHVAPHPWFTRKGNDLIVRLPLSLAEAALGAKVDVPTPRGTISLRVPPNSSSGKRLRIKGHGVKTRDGELGDLYAEVQIVLPPTLDEESLELIKKLDERFRSASPQDPRRDLRW